MRDLKLDAEKHFRHWSPRYTYVVFLMYIWTLQDAAVSMSRGGLLTLAHLQALFFIAPLSRLFLSLTVHDAAIPIPYATNLLGLPYFCAYDDRCGSANTGTASIGITMTARMRASWPFSILTEASFRRSWCLGHFPFTNGHVKWLTKHDWHRRKPQPCPRESCPSTNREDFYRLWMASCCGTPPLGRRAQWCDIDIDRDMINAGSLRVIYLHSTEASQSPGARAVLGNFPVCSYPHTESLMAEQCK